jgi:hypothetical protein
VFDEAGRVTKRVASDIVDRRLRVVEVAVGNPLEVGQVVDHPRLVSYGSGSHLLVVTHHDNLAPEVEGDETERIALACLVDDHDVESRGAAVERLSHAVVRLGTLHPPRQVAALGGRHLFLRPSPRWRRSESPLGSARSPAHLTVLARAAGCPRLPYVFEPL